MEFTIECPHDGELVVGLDSVENMIVHEEGHADITFRCPHCGTHIVISAPVPAFLISAMEGISRDLGIPIKDGQIVFNALNSDGDPHQVVPQFVAAPVANEVRLREITADEEAHVQFFCHELDTIRTVDEFLASCE